MKSLWRAETGIFFGLLLYLLWLARSQFLSDPGVFWSTRVGEQVLIDFAVPRQDAFSCTFSTQPWISQMWLSQCLMAVLHAVGGLDALVLAAVGCLAILYAWVAARLLRTGWHWFMAVLLVAATVLASRYHLHARPHIATIVCMGVTVAMLIDFEAGRVSLRGLLWMWLLFVLWTNLHTGVLGGVGTLGLTVIGWCAAWLVGANSPVRSVRDILGLFGIVTGCCLALLVNPYGWNLVGNVLGVMGSPVVREHILEHFPLDWSNPYQRMVLILALPYVLAMVNLRSSRAIQVTWLLPCVWFLLTLERIRQCTLFAITTSLVLVEVLPQGRFAAWLAENNSWLYQPREQRNEQGDPPRPCWKGFVLPGLALGIALLFQASGVRVPFVGAGWAQLDPILCPMPLREPLQAYAGEHPGAPVFNDLAYGGFLIYYTNLRPFIDDRCELYGDAFLGDYFRSNDAMLAVRGRQPALSAASVTALFGSPSGEGSVIATAVLLDGSTGRLPAGAAGSDCIERWAKDYHLALDLALVLKGSGFHYLLDSRPDEWVKRAETDLPYFGAALYQRKASLSLPKPAAPESR